MKFSDFNLNNLIAKLKDEGRAEDVSLLEDTLYLIRAQDKKLTDVYNSGMAGIVHLGLDNPDLVGATKEQLRKKFQESIRDVINSIKESEKE